MKATPQNDRQAFDVVVMGEILVEVATDEAFGHGVPAQLGISGDALNVAAAAAAAGAHVGLLSVLPNDDLGRAIEARISELGISGELLKFRTGQQGVYLVHSDPEGQREFSYARSGSVGSTLGPDDVDATAFSTASAVVASGITCAISSSSRAAVLKAATVSQRFVFDPNYRSRLTSAEDAKDVLRDLAPHSYLITPSFPGETVGLLDCTTAAQAAVKVLGLGARHVAVTCGAEGVHLAGETIYGSGAHAYSWIDSIPAPAVVDQTGAGDSFLGTLTARMVLGDSLPVAARYGAAAASLAVGGKGGSGLIPSFDQTRAHANKTQEGAISSHA